MQEEKIACLLESITEEQKLFTGLIAQAAKLNAQSKEITENLRLGLKCSKEFVKALKWGIIEMMNKLPIRLVIRNISGTNKRGAHKTSRLLKIHVAFNF